MDTNTILFGADQTERIVAVEPGNDKTILFIRDHDGVRTEERSFTPWLITKERYDLAGANWSELEGNGFRFLAQFSNWSQLRSARFKLRDSHIDHYALQTAAKQYLVQSGQTLFKGMAHTDIHRMQFDIETLSFSPDRPGGEVFLISVCDNRGLETLVEGTEQEILTSFVKLVRDLDPDVLEGHNILGFDLPYMIRRAEMLGMTLDLGRDGSPIIRGQEQNAAIGGMTRPSTPYFIYGRHVIDTLIGVQRYDVTKGALHSYGLKEAAKSLGIACPDRIIIKHDKIASTWKSDPDSVRTYCLQDSIETRSLSEIVSPAEFYMTQMVPDTYSGIVVSGTGEKINLIMVREYLRQGRSIPESSPPRPVIGGYTEVRRTGLMEHVVKCDVESLYPSLMLVNRIKPSVDTLDVFLPALEELTRRRFEAKAKSRSLTSPEKGYWEGLQASFKILINSFYGYLGAPLNFNDYDAAEQVTTAGQSVVKKIAEELERTGSKVIEIDTDGVYFQPPPGVDGEDAETAYIENVGSFLPHGIRLAHDGRFAAMLSLKVKNYVLVTYGGEKIFKGASVRSRADERFGRDFISHAVDLLIKNDKQGVVELYRSIRQEIEQKKMPVERFARRERITDKTFTSNARKRLAQAAKGYKVGDFVNVYERSDGSIGLMDDYADDEDIKKLLDKLYKFACRLREAFGDDFDKLFPKPSAKVTAESAGQQTLF